MSTIFAILPPGDVSLRHRRNVSSIPGPAKFRYFVIIEGNKNAVNEFMDSIEIHDVALYALYGQGKYYTAAIQDALTYFSEVDGEPANVVIILLYVQRLPVEKFVDCQLSMKVPSKLATKFVQTIRGHYS